MSSSNNEKPEKTKRELPPISSEAAREIELLAELRAKYAKLDEERRIKLERKLKRERERRAEQKP